MKHDRILLEHGAGGKLMRKLLEEVIIPTYKLNRVNGGIGLPEMDDGGTIPLGDYTLVMTTDAYTIKPIFFPGGDIGKLAICGTINDLSMMGAKPLALATSMIIEEGFPIDKLKKILMSMESVLEEVKVPIIAGDTKVMEKGKIDEIVISTCGIGIAKKVITDSGLKPGNKIIITGNIAEHEVALLAFREGLEFETNLQSDVAPLWELVNEALKIGGITVMKDPTRGGVAGALNEIARKSGVDIYIWESLLPIRDEVRGAVEMLGIDPLEATNEGIAIIGVESEKAESVLNAIRKTKYGRNAAIVGEAREGSGMVIMETIVGGKRIIEEPIGRPLPRIC